MPAAESQVADSPVSEVASSAAGLALPYDLRYSLVIVKTGDASGLVRAIVMRNVGIDTAEGYAEYMAQTCQLREGLSYEVFAPDTVITISK